MTLHFSKSIALFVCPSIVIIFSFIFFCLFLSLSYSSSSPLFPNSPYYQNYPSPAKEWAAVDSGQYAHQIHLENIKQIMNFQQRFEEAKLISEYGPAFADSYEHEDKVRTARLLKTIRQLHEIGK